MCIAAGSQHKREQLPASRCVMRLRRPLAAAAIGALVIAQYVPACLAAPTEAAETGTCRIRGTALLLLQHCRMAGTGALRLLLAKIGATASAAGLAAAAALLHGRQQHAA
jgi:hypothetical protein